MVPHYDLATLLIGLLGLAFLLVWSADRLNLAGLLWGIAHLSLGIAVFTGYRYMLTYTAWLGGVSLLAVSVFLVTLHAANRSLSGRLTSIPMMVMQTTAVALAVGFTGFVVNPISGRVLVNLAMIATYLWSAKMFARDRGQHVVGLAFALKACALLPAMVYEPEIFATPAQSMLYSILNWATSVLLALMLVSVAVHQSRRRLRMVIRHLPDAILARRLDGTVMFCNDAFARLAGARSPTELVGRPAPMLADDPSEAEAISREITEIARMGRPGAPIVLERSVRPAHGDPFPAEVIVSVFDDFGQNVVLAQIRDLTDRKNAEAERLRHATTDEITGLANRHFIEKQLATVLWECQRNQTQCAVLLIDLDHFKKVNDTMGHARGDAVIRETAQLLTTQRHERDLLGRLGGDEFVLVFTDLQPGAGTLVMEDRAASLCQLLAREIRQGDMRVLLGASIGIAFSGADGNTPAGLIQHAEVAMYEAKARGRGEWRFFDKNMDERIAEMLRLESALRLAIQGQTELQLAYQPIIEVGSGALRKVEALVRWNSPTLGPVSPARFIPLAEQSALILSLGSWVLEQAVRQAALWGQGPAPGPVVSINVSARQFTHPDFESQLQRTLMAHRVQPSQIELELTETLLASDGPELPALLQRLRDAGFGLALDDFGTGYSSLSYLSRFHLTTVKIDRSFIAELEDSARSRSLTKAIIALGHSLGLKVVAEGVETEAQRTFLVAEGCDFLQGFLLGRPVPAAQLQVG